MKAISDTLQFLNPFSSGFLKSSNSNTKEQILDKNVSANSLDKVNISSLSQFFSSQGMDVSNSTSSTSDSTMDFHLIFESESTERLTADGYFSEKTRKLEISFAYQFQQEIFNNGIKELHTFEANFSLKIENMEKVSITPFEKKEDIMDFAIKLIRKIIGVIGDDEKLLAGVIFDQEDLEELGKIDDGKLLEMIQQLIQMAMFLAKMRQIIEENEEPEKVFLNPIREKISGIDIKKDYTNVTEFHFEIRDITQEIADKGENTDVLDSKDEELETSEVVVS